MSSPLTPPIENTIRLQSDARGTKIQAINLGFRYPLATKFTLRHVNFTIEPGETLAIVGPNGQGKSTLTLLIMRLLEFQEGSLLINDVDIRSYDPTELHAEMCAVFQRSLQLPGTLRDNILVDDQSSEDAMQEVDLKGAMKAGGVSDFLDELPDALETKLVGKDPHKISGGQWSRVFAARAFYRARQGCGLMILDEPTAAMDPRSESALFARFKNLCRDPTSGRARQTTIMITHRFSNVHLADRIAVIDGGTVAEIGTHQELMARAGVYREFFDIQTESLRTLDAKVDPGP